MPVKGRSTSENEYRYWFNGQERDKEITGINGTHNTAEFWEYDARLGRRWNLDPVSKPWLSDYSVLGNNPLIYKDFLGNDFVNGHTKKRESAEKQLKGAEDYLKTATESADQFAGCNDDDLKTMKREDPSRFRYYKQTQRYLTEAIKDVENAKQTLADEIEKEKIVDQVLAQLKDVNKEFYEKFDKYNPDQKGVIDITVMVSRDKVKMKDSYGVPTGETTIEGTSYQLDRSKKDVYIRCNLTMVYVDKKIVISTMTGVMVHGLGHVDNKDHDNENEANKFEKENYNKFLPK